ncbi:hypothetical protein [Streptomyces bicolor]|uniref:hypothetical protein n=1 Tax=Streptomyces bicolor TaxID=66874 RepID=UPI0004E14B16|nr:hypothetical protein [Streptomyces bicolor]
MSTSWTDKLVAGAQVATTLIAATTLLVSVYGDIPDGLGTVVILALGGATALFTWVRVDPAAHPTRARVLLAGLVGVVFVTAAVLVWPGVWPNEEEASPKTAASKVDDPKASARQIKVTKMGGEGVNPGVTVKINSCITVSGTGKIPSEYGLWVANTYDADGTPSLDGLFNLQRASQTEGETAWQTARFGVGGDENDEGKPFWIYVFLLPASADSALRNLSAGGAPGLKAPVTGATEVGRYAVERKANLTCPWQKEV